MPRPKPPGDFADVAAPARRALAAAGIASLEDLARAKAADLAQLHGMGAKGLDILRRKLSVRGLTFADEA